MSGKKRDHKKSKGEELQESLNLLTVSGEVDHSLSLHVISMCVLRTLH